VTGFILLMVLLAFVSFPFVLIGTAAKGFQDGKRDRRRQLVQRDLALITLGEPMAVDRARLTLISWGHAVSDVDAVINQGI
jgi:hypothetical protein